MTLKQLVEEIEKLAERGCKSAWGKNVGDAYTQLDQIIEKIRLARFAGLLDEPKPVADPPKNG